MDETGAITTLGDLIDAGMGMHIYCRGCDRHAVADLAMLAERLGRDWVFIGRTLPVVCSACGSRRSTFRLAIDPEWIKGRKG